MLMRGAAFAVLVIPYALDAFPEVAYALCRGLDEHDWWHPRTGIGARGETPLAAARRVAAVRDADLIALESRAFVAVERCRGRALSEHAFGARVDPAALPEPGGERQLWVSYEVADGLLHREAERNALWELRHRLGAKAACGPKRRDR